MKRQPTVSKAPISPASPTELAPHGERYRYWGDPILWAILALALALRIGYNLALHPDGHPPSSFIIDEREYFGAAHVLGEGRGFSFFDTALWLRPPLYVAFLSALIPSAENTHLVMLAQSALSAGALLPLGWLASRVAGRGAARFAVGIGALYLPFTLFAGLLLSETLFIFLFSFALIPLVKAREALFSASGMSGLMWAVAAGVLLGLGALTRSTALGFAPLAAVWLLLPGWRGKHRLIATGALLAACALVIAPWVARNYAAYGRVVAIDTTGGYNLWLGSVGVRDEERLQAELRPLANPVERQELAYRRAFERIGADPAFFVRKGLEESLDLWRPLFSAEERQVAGFTLGRVPAWHLGALLVLDDLLYLLVLVLAIAGLALSPPHPLKWLTGLWVLLWVALSFVFFAVTRFRLPIVTVLVPWAGVGASIVLRPGTVLQRAGELTREKRLIALGGVIAALLVVVPAIELNATGLGVRRWEEQKPYREAESLLREGRAQEAVELYRQANLTLADTRYGLAAALLQTGDPDEALAQLRADEPPDRFEPYIIKGQAARMAGDLEGARSFFNERVVRLAGDAALQWSWDHLSPNPVEIIELGSGLEIGYVRGFHGPEVDAEGVSYRWTTDRAEFRMLSSGFGAYPRIVWSGWRPEGLPQAQVSIAAQDGKAAGPIPVSVSPSWEVRELEQIERRVARPPRQPVSSLPVYELGGAIRVNTFVLGGSDPRLLGVRVARIEVAR